MNQKLFILSFVIIPLFGLSKGKESLPSYWIIKDSISSKIHPDSVKLVFRVEDSYSHLMLDQHSAVVQVKIDGKTKKFPITYKDRTFKLTLSKGEHKLDFYLNANFDEIHLVNEFIGKHYYEIGMNFQGSANSGRQLMLEKPVIYLYSEKEEPFSLKVKTDAELKFTYPAYDREWKGTTSPDGTIQMAGSNYPYLFWDAELPIKKLILNWHNSDQILGEQTIQYLSAQLDHLGFNPKEKSDFITYWGPRMQKMKYLEIIWLQNESINDIASLNISPAYIQNRIYIIFKEISDLRDETLQLKPTTLIPINRKDSYLVEWGGIEIEANL